MERAVAITKLKKLLGKGFGYQVDNKAPTAEERAAAKADLPEAMKIRDELKQMRHARYEAILAADREYQELKADYNKAQKLVEGLSSKSRHFKFTVGTSNGMFFHVKAEGDSWEEVIAKLTK